MARRACLLSVLLLLSAAPPVRAQSPADGAGKGAVSVPAEPLKATPAAPLSAWSKPEIDLALSRCNALLMGSSAVTLPAQPIREGECGAPAPVELISIGKAPQVTLSAPATITCDMVATLEKWVKNELQPAARELLGSPIVRIEVMSAYSCRNAYGRKKTRMSEHGRANALDIRAFVTERGETIEVLGEWGPTERDIKARIAAAAKAETQRAEAIKREAERASAAIAAKGKPADKAPLPAPSAPGLRGTLPPEPPPAATVILPPGLVRKPETPALGLTPPVRLGGPKAVQQPSSAAMPNTLAPKARFLHRIHAAACRVFGTTLGPEANDAHRNHFHIDMAERNGSNYCE